MRKKSKTRVVCGAIAAPGPYGMVSWQPIYKDIEVDVGDDPNDAQDDESPQRHSLRGAEGRTRMM